MYILSLQLRQHTMFVYKIYSPYDVEWIFQQHCTNVKIKQRGREMERAGEKSFLPVPPSRFSFQLLSRQARRYIKSFFLFSGCAGKGLKKNKGGIYRSNFVRLLLVLLSGIKLCQLR